MRLNMNLNVSENSVIFLIRFIWPYGIINIYISWFMFGSLHLKL